MVSFSESFHSHLLVSSLWDEEGVFFFFFPVWFTKGETETQERLADLVRAPDEQVAKARLTPAATWIQFSLCCDKASVSMWKTLGKASELLSGCIYVLNVIIKTQIVGIFPVNEHVFWWRSPYVAKKEGSWFSTLALWKLGAWTRRVFQIVTWL